MNKRRISIFLVILCTLFTSTAQLLYKSGADKLEFNFLSIISNWNILLGLMLYGVGAILLISALRYGKVSILYPIIALNFIWVALGSMYFFGEIITLLKVMSISLIIIGILIINFSGKEVLKFTEAV